MDFNKLHTQKSANPFQNQDRNGLNQQQQKVAATATYNQIQLLHSWKRTLCSLNQVMRAILSNVLELKWLYTTIAHWNILLASYHEVWNDEFIQLFHCGQENHASSRNVPTGTSVARRPLQMENPLDDSDNYTGDSGFRNQRSGHNICTTQHYLKVLNKVIWQLIISHFFQ